MNKNSVIKFIEHKSIFRKMMGSTLFILAILMVLDLPFAAGVFVFFGMLLVNERGFEFNKENNTYRTKSTYLFISIGKWKKFENFEYVTIFPTKETHRVNGIAAQADIVKNIFFDVGN